MKKQFHTPQGIIERELTQSEIQIFADEGDDECRKEIFREKYINAPGLDQRVEVIAQFLGLI